MRTVLALALLLAGCTTFAPASPGSERATCAAFDGGPTAALTADELLNITRGLESLREHDRRPVMALVASSLVTRPDEEFASIDASIEPTGYYANQSTFLFRGNRTVGGQTTASMTVSVGVRTWTLVHDVFLHGTPLIDDAHAIAVENASRSGKPTWGERLASWSPREPGCLTIQYRELPPHRCNDGICVSPAYTTLSTAKVDLGARSVVSWS